MKMKEILVRKEAVLLLAIIIAATVTLLSAFFPAGVVFSGYYQGISYHGFPAAWMGATAGPELLTNMYASLQIQGYIAGFLFDFLFWFFLAFILLQKEELAKLVGV